MEENKMDKTRYSSRATYGDLAFDLDYAEREYRLNHAGEEREEEQYGYIRPARRPEARPQARPAARPRQSISPVTAICCIAILTVLLLTVLSYVTLDRVSNEIVELKSELSELQQKNVDLTTKHELTFDLYTVKQEAEAAGMAKPSGSQTYYLDLSGEDNAVIYQQSESDMGHLLSSLKQSICAVMEYFR